MNAQIWGRNARDSNTERKRLRMQRRRQIESDTGMRRSTLYDHIRRGIFVPPIRLGANSVAWLEHETQAILAARVAGKSDDDIRALVKELVATRTEVVNHDRQ